MTRNRYEDPEEFLLTLIEQADDRMGTGTAEILGAVAGAALALAVPFTRGILLRGVIGSAIGTLVGKKVAETDSTWFRKRLNLALDRFEEINRLTSDGTCEQSARDEYVDDLIERFFDRSDTLLE